MSTLVKQERPQTEPIEFVAIAIVNENNRDIHFHALTEEDPHTVVMLGQAPNPNVFGQNGIMFKNVSTDIQFEIHDGDLLNVVGGTELNSTWGRSSQLGMSFQSPIKIHTERVDIVAKSGQFNRQLVLDRGFFRMTGHIVKAVGSVIQLQVRETAISLRGTVSPVNVGDEVEVSGWLLRGPFGIVGQPIQPGEFLVRKTTVLHKAGIESGKRKWWQLWK